MKCSWGKESGDPNNAQAAGQVSEQVNVLICVVLFIQVGGNSDWLRAGRFGGRIPVGNDIIRPRPARPWGPPSLLYNGHRVFAAGKAVGARR